MATGVSFPFYVLADDRLMFLVESPERDLYHMEPIDIENEEHRFWDANGKGVRITVKHEKVSSIEYCDTEMSLTQAFRSYAKGLGVDVNTSGPPDEVYFRLKEAEAHLPRRRGFLSNSLVGSGHNCREIPISLAICSAEHP